MYYAANDLLCVIVSVVFVACLYAAYRLGEQEGYRNAMNNRRRRRINYSQFTKKQ